MDGSKLSGGVTGALPPVPCPVDLVGECGHSDGIWFGVGKIPVDISQGWKLYVSATVTNYVPTLIGVARIFFEKSIPFKYLNSHSRLRDQNAGIFGYSQVGKCIVAYTYRVAAIKELLLELKMLLDASGHEGPFVPRVPFAWPGGSVFYRYGGYRSGDLRLGGQNVQDDRSEPRSIIARIPSNPFISIFPEVSARPQSVGFALPSILERYPVTSPICRSGKGGVFIARNSQSATREEVVVKIGLRLGNMLPDGRDASYFLAREFDMYQAMRASGLSRWLACPIAFSRESIGNLMVLEKICGQNLGQWRADGGVDVSRLVDAVSVIERVHEAGFSLGDAKTANFIASPSGMVLLDLESAHCLSLTYEAMPSTFALKGLSGLSPTAFDVIHFLISAVFKPDLPQVPLSIERSIDVPGFVHSFAPADLWDEAALKLLRIALQRLADDPSLVSIAAAARLGC